MASLSNKVEATSDFPLSGNYLWNRIILFLIYFYFFLLFKFFLILPQETLECVSKHTAPTKDELYISKS